jgi:hypothetical protein
MPSLPARQRTKRSASRLVTLGLSCTAVMLGSFLSNAAAQILDDRLDLQLAHNHPDVVGLIDGGQHPELIPDKVAYRLYFVVVSEMPNPSDQESLRQAAHLKPIGITKQEDMHSLSEVLTDFKVRYTELIANYNQLAEAADKAGTTPDFQTFLQKRDELVQFTRDRLKSTLSAEALARLHARVQSEKKHMKVSVGEVQ